METHVRAKHETSVSLMQVLAILCLEISILTTEILLELAGYLNDRCAYSIRLEH